MNDARQLTLKMKPELTLPRSFETAIVGIALEVDQTIVYDAKAAFDLAQRELDLLVEAETSSQRRLHKGHPLHNLGAASYATQPRQARRFFMAAHAEDVRLWPRLRPRWWDFLAERMLLALFHEPPRVIKALEQLARREPRRPPLEVADQVLRHVPPPDFPDRPVELMDEASLAAVDATRRVFVGGSYPNSLDRIDVIEAAVRSRGYLPVVVNQFRTRPRERARPKSFRLLDSCSSAIFEGTSRIEPGWWPELERIVQVRPAPTLVTYLALQKDDDIHTSSMFPRPADCDRLEIRPFGNLAHLAKVVEWWLDYRLPYLFPSAGGTRLATFPGTPLGRPPVHSEVDPFVPPSGVPYVTAEPSNTRYAGGSATPYAQPGSATPYAQPGEADEDV